MKKIERGEIKIEKRKGWICIIMGRFYRSEDRF